MLTWRNAGLSNGHIVSDVNDHKEIHIHALLTLERSVYYDVSTWETGDGCNWVRGKLGGSKNTMAEAKALAEEIGRAMR